MLGAVYGCQRGGRLLNTAPPSWSLSNGRKAKRERVMGDCVERGPKEGFPSVKGALDGHSGENVTIIRKSYDFANILVGVGYSLLFNMRIFFQDSQNHTIFV